MTYDLRVPADLKLEQIWFGSIIGRPVGNDNLMNPIAPSGVPMEVEAADHIAPSPTLRPDQRIQIYNQQYWWRLINAMQESFPLVSRMFGFYEFNRVLAIPYLVKYPPRHWAISTIGDRLTQWVAEEYHEGDKSFIADVVALDWGFLAGMSVPELPSLSQLTSSGEVDADKISEEILYTQPHVHFFGFDYDLFKYRTAYLQHDHEYWAENVCPELDRSRFFHMVLYRNSENRMSWVEIDEIAFAILKKFQQGSTIDAVVEWLEHQDAAMYEKALEHFQEWFQGWTARGWLAVGRKRDL